MNVSSLNIMMYNKIVIEFENEVWWVYDESEKNLLFHTGKIDDLAKWIEDNTIKRPA